MQEEEQKASKGKSHMITPVTMTCEEAACRHSGFAARHFARLCLRGKWLLSRYGTVEKVPPAERAKALFAKKVIKVWVIPVSELDRVFMANQK